MNLAILTRFYKSIATSLMNTDSSSRGKICWPFKNRRSRLMWRLESSPLKAIFKTFRGIKQPLRSLQRRHRGHSVPKTSTQSDLFNESKFFKVKSLRFKAVPKSMRKNKLLHSNNSQHSHRELSNLPGSSSSNSSSSRGRLRLSKK